MKLEPTLYVKTGAEWRAWLEQNYDQEKEIWLIYYKAQSGQPTISYEVSVEEALCFGWIDSIIQKINEDKYARKFTPRTNTVRWSDNNKRRLAKLIQEGRMTAIGLSKVNDLSILEEAPKPRPKELTIPDHVEQVLKEHPRAWAFFCTLPPSQKRLYIGWITSAKRAETVDRRLKEAVDLLEQNRPLGLK